MDEVASRFASGADGATNSFFACNSTSRSAGVPQAVVFLVRPLLMLSEFAYQKWPFLIKPKNPLLTLSETAISDSAFSDNFY